MSEVSPMSTSYEYLIVTPGTVATVTINRPDKLNALNSSVVAELRRALTELEADDAVRCVILTGAGEKAFVAGADIGEMQDMTPQQAVRFVEDGQDLMNRFEASRLPIIAAVNGFALGGGCELALAADIRIASAKAKLGLPEVKLGLIPGFGGTQRLARLVGKGKALELIMSADMINAEEAHRIGLVERVCDPAEVMAAATKLAETIASRSPAAVALAKRSVMRALETTQREGCTFEAAQFGVVNSTADKREGVAAFLEKRDPSFTGK